MNLSIQQMVDEACRAAEEKKAHDIVVLDISGVSVICDYFIICSANSTTQVKAIAENIQDKMARQGVALKHREGLREGNWVLLDYGDVVVHIFREKERHFYNLERLWGDAEVVHSSAGN
ncbi:ribosome-associated protein [Desulfohalotomaculum tongense]|uniref:ribosome silencing factor n=1 Tax=Desulforadius tongensis TaxID=1216062 RepID=UPI001957FF84|nr:ribosome silencing factor [Desulforadius tongensis]MBM7855689.1 ribosome-associated protein [Desulforadius tongensis]